MKFKNGRSVSVNNPVIGKIGENLVAGIVHSIVSDTTAKIVYPEIGRAVYADVNPEEFYHAEDALAAAELINSGKVVPVAGSAPAAPSTPANAA